jgi:hypothetical protein
VIGTPVVVGVVVGVGVPVAGASTDAGVGMFVGDINTVGVPTEEDSGDGGQDGVNCDQQSFSHILFYTLSGCAAQH